MRPMALVRAELGFVVPVESVGERGGGAEVSACMRPHWGRGLGPLVIRSGIAPLDDGGVISCTQWQSVTELTRSGSATLMMTA
jgi:hypothetical protein